MPIDHRPPVPLERQRGITLIESLVAIVIATLGILGILGMQMRTLSDTQSTVRRAQAIRLIEDLSERTRVNPNAMASIESYVSDFDDKPTPGSCQSQGCSHAELVAYDLGTWKQAVANTLPLGEAKIFLPKAEKNADNNRRQLGVMVAWRNSEKTPLPENPDKASQDCPSDMSCHLQYITVAARCAPYLGAVKDATKYFCAGA
ncbi:type IV pilus modification protein PilV [Comamonas composti]|uniref:type IV pilus modification protein PilV n=1 Tax=Comamonas composti TaxID=408558 RepID=UPI0005506FAE|nr:type IV pilus modification protein PilV [Comamonas composti]